MNLVLIGYRGCGKSSVGRLVARSLKAGFVDLDDRVREHLGGRTVAEIWQTDGEPAYRAAEVALTGQVLKLDHQIIALGGGTLMQDAARQAIVSADHTQRIYLACDPHVLHQRIDADRDSITGRPALTTLGGGLDEIQQMLKQRDPIYRAVADKVIDVTALTLEQTAQRVLAHLAAFS